MQVFFFYIIEITAKPKIIQTKHWNIENELSRLTNVSFDL